MWSLSFQTVREGEFILFIRYFFSGYPSIWFLCVPNNNRFLHKRLNAKEYKPIYVWTIQFLEILHNNEPRKNIIIKKSTYLYVKWRQGVFWCTDGKYHCFADIEFFSTDCVEMYSKRFGHFEGLNKIKFLFVYEIRNFLKFEFFLLNQNFNVLTWFENCFSFPNLSCISIK